MRTGVAPGLAMVAAGAALVLACPSEVTPNGALLGSFTLSVTQKLQDSCSNAPFTLGTGSSQEVDPSSFVGALYLDSAGGVTLVSGPTQLIGSLEGANGAFSLASQAQREIPRRRTDGGVQCGCLGSVSETFEGSLYGKELSHCAEAGTVDAGPSTLVVNQAPRANLICGVLNDEMSAPDCDAGCEPCLVVYQIEGIRQ